MNRRIVVNFAVKAALGVAVLSTSARGVETAGTSQTQVPWTMPGVSVNSPAGFGASWGQVFLGGGFQQRARFTTTSDGAIGAGFGMGNPTRIVGFETSVSVLDVSSFSRGGISFKVHRVLPKGWGVAIGRENAITWGSVDSGAQSWYGSVSKIFFLKESNKWFSALTLTAGAGNGRFRSEAATNAGTDTVNIFGSASIRVAQPVSFIADWTGQDLSLGLSLTPFRKFPFFINPSLADVTGNAGDGARFVLGAGMAYTFNTNKGPQS